MVWQDIAIALCQFGFIIAFLPTIRGKDKPAVTTSVANAVFLCIIAFCLASLSLWLAVVTTSINALQWAIVASQKASINKQGYRDVRKRKQ